ncbi:Homeodomain-like protein [Scenedesmus sp. NREL 46B-D3]|nr:Homeodomain-like protein [Scenedesmus sp. NREL 46B-D3]
MEERKRRPWTKEEDEVLRRRIKTYGLNNWSVVADGLPGRSGKSCSERWRIYLTPGVKRPTLEPFNEWETAVIYLGQQVHGNQWCSIAKALPGRTNTAIKNYWKTALLSAEHKRVANNRFIQQGHTLDSLLANPPSTQELAASAARRRKAAAAAKAKAAAAAAAAAQTETAAEDQLQQQQSLADFGQLRATSSSSAAAAVTSNGCSVDASGDEDAPMMDAAWCSGGYVHSPDHEHELCAALAGDWDFNSDATDMMDADSQQEQHHTGDAEQQQMQLLQEMQQVQRSLAWLAAPLGQQ